MPVELGASPEGHPAKGGPSYLSEPHGDILMPDPEAGASRAPRPSVLTLPRLPVPPPKLLDYLDQRFPRVGRAVWRERLAGGKVTDHTGEALGPATGYRVGLRVRYFREVAKEPRIPVAEKILFRDEHLLVADKPHFLPVTPGGSWVNECLLYRLQRATGIEHLTPLHRLDRMTAGLVLFSTDPGSRGSYHQLFDQRQILREYHAVAAAPRRPADREWRIESRLEQGEPWFRMATVPGAVNAITHIELTGWRDGLARFRLRPETGKTHQLRIHMAEIGYPIVGDPFYPVLRPEAPPDYGRPLMLLAHRLRFRDPVSGDERDFRSSQSLAP